MDKILQQSIERAAAALRASGAGAVYIFGSAASDTTGPDSDVDFAVSGLPMESFFVAMGKARDALGRDLDMIDLDDDNPFTRYLKEEGELRRVL